MGDSVAPQMKEAYQLLMAAFNIDKIDARDLFMAIMSLKHSELSKNTAAVMKKYEAKKHLLPNCKKTGCSGKIQVTVSNNPEAEGLHLCDKCHTFYRAKK
jgi:hypothetical protein